VLEFDIKGLFDNIDHQLLMKAVNKHTDNRWLRLYIERWLTAPIQVEAGTTVNRKRGVPQGGVISPVLANLFMHYAFDKWLERHFPDNPFCRYADDGLVHCHSEAQAKTIQAALAIRLQECGLEMHPDKTRIVYCKDSDRREEHPVTSFDFLGYTFRPRRSKNRWGKYFINFSPAMSATAGKAMRQEVRRWKLHLRSDKSLLDLARMFRATIQGWINYYGRFYKSAMYPTLRHINRKLCLWAMRKYKKLKHHKRRAEYRLGAIAKQHPGLFPHWTLGVKPAVG
jgi:RNA-directed DNA polymerase